MTKLDLNLLQEHGIIADNCVTWEDVPDYDRPKARKWLRENETKRKNCTNGKEQ